MNPNEQKQTDVLAKSHEKEWWKWLIAGDRNGLSSIYSAFIDQMFSYGMAIIADRDFVKDCIQEVFIDLWKYRFNLSKTEHVKLYLFKSLRSKMYRISANENKNRKLDIQSTNQILMPSHEDALINNQRTQELQHKLAQGIEKLPHRQREVIRLIFFEKQSYEETSSLMDINIRSVYTLAWKALSSLRKYIPSTYLLLIMLSFLVV